MHALLGPAVEPSLWIFIVFYGLDWVATVPPTVALCREHFGPQRATAVFGWVFAAWRPGSLRRRCASWLPPACSCCRPRDRGRSARDTLST
ncbi:hypothetical protein ACIBI9_49435 [Nonomuraea sp. NPDC050451]|uniref:hypothetical protein n=1 Tax=Nonomuraea sp. NPDC050451 TaxID=3364364 RepID=UPI0037B4CF8D